MVVVPGYGMTMGLSITVFFIEKVFWKLKIGGKTVQNGKVHDPYEKGILGSNS